MLRLTKSVSDENYPLTPQTSAVRKLKVRANVANVADLSSSYLIIKNSLSTNINGTAVVRNVGWGMSMSQKNQWQYPATCQIRTASLTIGGQQVEYNEDLHVRKVNMDVYTKSVEKLRKEANYGGQGFQRLEGAKVLTDPTTAVAYDGNYVSPFLGDGCSSATAKQQPGYNTVSSVIYLGDVFEFCKQAQSVSLAGKEVVIELQFEDRNTLLTEFVNYATDLTTNPAAPQPYPYQTIAIDTTAVVKADGTPFDAATYALADVVSFNTTDTYNHIRDFPLYVGQPICLWKNNSAPTVVGSNYMLITGLELNGNKTIKISFKAYTLGGQFVRTAGNQVTPAQVAANIGGNAGVGATVSLCVAISGVNDPVLVAGQNTVYTNIDAGLSSKYTVAGLELVMCEMPQGEAAQKAVKYIQYMRDVDVIPTGQLTYQKSFQLDPGCAAVFAMFPCAQAAGGAQTNMLSISHRAGVSTGLSWRNMIDGESLYSRDIVFSMASDAVEPLYTHRLYLAATQLMLPIENLVQNQTWLRHDGVSCHAMIAEPVPLSEQPQQLAVRLNFTTNAASRTIYVYKAIMREFAF